MPKVGYEKKVESVKEYINGKISQIQGAKKCDVSIAAFQVWIRKYQSEGEAGLKESKKYKRYSAELKEEAVKDYLSGNTSQEEVCTTYKITSKTQLQRWII